MASSRNSEAMLEAAAAFEGKLSLIVGAPRKESDGSELYDARADRLKRNLEHIDLRLGWSIKDDSPAHEHEREAMPPTGNAKLLEYRYELVLFDGHSIRPARYRDETGRLTTARTTQVHSMADAYLAGLRLFRGANS